MNPYQAPQTPMEDAPLPGSDVADRVRLLRWLVVASTLLFLTTWFFPWEALPMSPGARVMLEASGYGAAHPALLEVVPYVFLAAWLIAAMGVFFLRSWGRFLFAALWLVGVPVRLFQGIAVETALQRTFYDVNVLCDGAILVLLFTAPLSLIFRKSTPG